MRGRQRRARVVRNGHAVGAERHSHAAAAVVEARAGACKGAPREPWPSPGCELLAAAREAQPQRAGLAWAQRQAQILI